MRWFIVIFGCLWLSVAQAHKIKLFVTTDGQVMNGYVYFPGGGQAQQATVTVTIPPDDKPLATLQTDGDGKFTYVAQQVADYLFTVNVGDGHRANYQVKTSELGAKVPPEIIPNSLVITKSNGNCSKETQLIETIVHKQIQPLREQLEQYEEKVRIHDILGGIGYILGFYGLLIYLRYYYK